MIGLKVKNTQQNTYLGWGNCAWVYEMQPKLPYTCFYISTKTFFKIVEKMWKKDLFLF